MDDKLAKIISKVRNINEGTPTNATGSSIANYNKFLFPVDDDLITQDYQTPAEPGLAKDEFLGVYPVMKLQLDKSSDGPSIDSMVDASREYVNRMDNENKKSPVENVIDIIRSLQNIKEDAPVNNVGGGAIAGTAQAGDNPPVFKRKRNPTPVGRYGSRRMWLQNLKKNGK
tara:strand:- start:200 stop:712 length:513 start_codon:yes stop_codon:yes gene_type:complete